MTPDEILRTVERLSLHFDLPEVKVVFSKRAKTSRAWPARKLMSVSLSDWHDPRFAMIHEFAHLLRGVRDRGRGESSHDGKFYAALIRVATFVLGGPKEYPWETEYGAIHARARRDGLTTKTWFMHDLRRNRLQQQAANPRPLTHHVPSSDIKTGDRVTWFNQHQAGRQEGIVIFCRRNSRLRVKVAEGRQIYVPRGMATKI